MYQPRANLEKALKHQDDRTHFNGNRQRPRNPEIDAEPSNSPLDALAMGLVSIGEKFTKRRASFRIP